LRIVTFGVGKIIVNLKAEKNQEPNIVLIIRGNFVFEKKWEI